MITWKKAYRGPFTLKGGEEIVEQLRKAADPDKNGLYDAKIRPARTEGKYDIYIKTEKHGTN